MRDYKHILNKVIPYHTDNSSSLYEFVGRLYEYLKDFEGSLDGAHEKIDEFINSFIMELDETTKKTLTEWHDDGTLAELINLVWDEKADKYYVDNLVNRTANALTGNYIQADSNLRDQLTDGYTQADDNLRGQINASVSAVETALDNKITGVRATASAVQFEFINDSVLDYARAMRGNFKVIRSSDATDVPSGHRYSTGFILKRNDDFIRVVLYNVRNPSNTVSNVCYSGEWTGWEEIGGSETAIEILEKIKSVDGDGSGLDADTLDGLQGFEFARQAHTHDMSAVYPSLDSTPKQGPDTPDKFVNLISVEGKYRYVFTVKFGAINMAQFSIPYFNYQPEEQYISFRSRYQQGTSPATWSDWYRVYPTKHGTGNPPTLQPGEIYLKY